MPHTAHRDVFSDRQSPNYRWSRRLIGLDTVLQLLAVIAVALTYGLVDMTPTHAGQLLMSIVVSMGGLCGTSLVRYWLSNHRASFVSSERSILIIHGLWLVGIVPILVLTLFSGNREQGWELVIRWSEFAIIIRALFWGAEAVRAVHMLGWSPAFVLVVSFVILIAVGTFLLWLPASRNPGADATSPYPTWLTALYTATSACCVTGLVIVDTGSYWSPAGQFIIMCLIQVGGLGIMTFGGFVALISGRASQVGEDVLFRDLFDSDQIVSVRSMILAILTFTLVSELIGAILLWGMWPELPFGTRLFYCVFHSIAAFCNAGFALPADNANLMGYGTYWHVWGVIAGLVIVGGLGFGVLNDIAQYVQINVQNWRRGKSYVREPRPRARLGLNTSLVLFTTLALLLGGTLALFVLDKGGAIGRLENPWERLSAAWFQSAMARTAGFNTVDIGALQPASKLVLIGLMFIGASPVSTGGGIKTTNLAIGFLSLVTILRGRDQVEIWGRSISDSIVRKAATIMGTAGVIVVLATLGLCYFEQNGALFLDYLFESTSAFATVGLSTGVSNQLTIPSLLVITWTMFIGRVGQLTLFVAVAGRVSAGRYQYPSERIILG